MTSDSIRDNLQRYHSLRKHDDQAFAQQVSRIEHWKTTQLQQCYATFLDDPRYSGLLNYYFNEVFTGIDLSEFRDADMAISIIDKFFTGTQMLQAALQFNALTGEINQSLAQYLFEDLGLTRFSDEDYLEACHRQGVVSLMDQQLEQFEIFADDLNTTINNRGIRTAIRMARIPAKLGGFSKMYQLVAGGLEILKGVDNPEAVASLLISHERKLLSRLKEKQLPLFPAIGAS